MKTLLYVTVGVAFTGLGIVGLLLPVVPQIPFFAVAFCSFLRCSERLTRKFTGSRFYRNHVTGWRKKYPLAEKLFPAPAAAENKA